MTASPGEARAVTDKFAAMLRRDYKVWQDVITDANEPNPCETMDLETGSWQTGIAM